MTTRLNMITTWYGKSGLRVYMHRSQMWHFWNFGPPPFLSQVLSLQWVEALSMTYMPVELEMKTTSVNVACNLSARTSELCRWYRDEYKSPSPPAAGQLSLSPGLGLGPRKKGLYCWFTYHRKIGGGSIILRVRVRRTFIDSEPWNMVRMVDKVVQSCMNVGAG